MPVRSRCWCEAEGITLYAQIVNVSEAGMAIRTFSPLQRGSRVRIRFILGGEFEVSAEADVVWAREVANGSAPGMGLRFVTIEPHVLDALRSYVTHAAVAETTDA